MEAKDTTDNQRLIGLLETAMQALVASQQQQAALIARIQTGSALQVSATTPQPALPEQQRTVGQWLDIHWQAIEQRGYKAQTIKNRRSNVEHIRRIWGAQAVAELRPHQVASGLKEFMPARLGTAHRVLSELRDALTQAVQNDWAATNAATPVKLPVMKVKRARLKIETWHAMRTLAKTGPQRWVESMLLLALVIGQRRADLAKARFEDIVTDDAGLQYLRIQQQKEAGKGYGARVEIPLSLRMDAIGMTVGDVIEHCRNSPKPGPTLLRKAGGGRIEESSLSARFHECIVAVLGEDAHVLHQWPSLHECRSLSARTYLEQGLSMETVQTLLGHLDVEMTEMYANDRGLSAGTWKRVSVASS